jgi:hypothetical protein
MMTAWKALAATLIAGLVLASCGGASDHGLARMVEWSDGCCRPAWRCAIAAIGNSALGADPAFELRPPEEAYRPGARQDFRVVSGDRRGTMQWTEASVSYRFLGEMSTHPLPCRSDEVGPLP